MSGGTRFRPLGQVRAQDCRLEDLRSATCGTMPTSAKGGSVMKGQMPRRLLETLQHNTALADRSTILNVAVPEAHRLKRGFRRRYSPCDPHLALQTRPRPRCDADPELILSRVRGLCLAPWRGKFDPSKSSAMSAPMRASLYAACLRRIVPPFGSARGFRSTHRRGDRDTKSRTNFR